MVEMNKRFSPRIPESSLVYLDPVRARALFARCIVPAWTHVFRSGSESESKSKSESEWVSSFPIQGWCDTPFTGRIELVPGVPDGYASRIVAARPGVGARCTERPVSFPWGTWRSACARSYSVGNVRRWTVGRVAMVGASGTRLQDAASAGRAHATPQRRGGRGG